jgi:5-methylcytosine-specific restriction protein A
MPQPPWKAWYKIARWRALRLAIFLRDLYTCRKCGLVEGNTSLLVCDHIKPHRGDAACSGMRPTCRRSANPATTSLKQAEEQTSLHMRGVWY